MCPGAESRGIINGDQLVNVMIPISKGNGNGIIELEYHHEHEEKNMRARVVDLDHDLQNEGGATTSTNVNNIKRLVLSFLHHLHQFINGLLPNLSLAEVCEELQGMAKIALPIIMTSMLIYSRSAISMFFLGRLGKAELAGGSLALGFGNITGTSVLKGLSMGMDPICCQAYGAKRWSVLGQTFYKTVCLLLLVSIPISIIWLNMAPILEWLGQDPEVTKVAQVYMAFSIPELVAQAHLYPLRSFIRNQGITAPLTISAVGSALLHLPVIHFFATYLNLGVKGVALAIGLNTINMNLGLLVYLFVSDKPVKPWKGVTILSAFQGWWPLLSLALPSALSVCLEWWWYEIMLFLCGLLSNAQSTVAAMGILIQTTGFLYVFPYSLSAAITTRIGHALGAGQPSRAQCTSIVGVTLAFSLGVLAFIFTISVRSVWGRLFTNETQILNLVTAALPILGLCEIGNWPQTVGCGVLTGTARPYMGARINMCAFYLIGLPVAIFAAFIYNVGFLGLWLGMLAAQISCFSMMVYTLIHTDWGNQSKRAEELSLAGGEKEEKEDEDEDEESGLLNSDL
ncbi:Protein DETOXIFICATION [Quillaja saponaria]|uniref:Protein DETOXIFICATION n=1 Tax=Quillaja saponaria TaxID=32244 RepID=A0AAD7LN22_QUISA|nr:Protein DETOXIFICATION [Quillaja saponaria]